MSTPNQVETEDEEQTYGPALPPHLRSKPSEPSAVVGPRPFGPVLPSAINQPDDDDGESDTDTYGPSLPGTSTITSRQLEIRALQIQLNEHSSGAKETVEREEWMLELPSKELKLTLGPRQFSKSNAEKETASNLWTDTPSKKTSVEKSEKNLKKRLYEERKEAERVREQEKIVHRHEKKHKRDKSLMEIHVEKSKKKEKSSKKEERRPFDRNTDLQISQLSSLQRKSVIEKAGLLDSRFSSGKEKFL